MPAAKDRNVILIAGPTASGKSALALALAERLGGMVINADSMQVYRDLRIITARPRPEEAARAPHALYGHVDAAESYSVGRWLTDAERAMAEASERGLVPILVGGTGLYFRSLTAGLAAVPPIPPAVRAAVRARLAARGPQALHAELARRDAAAAARLNPRDGIRIVRALEVIEATGRPLVDWQREQARPAVAPERAARIVLAVDPNELRQRIEGRFEAMLASGALEEVAALAARDLDPLLPAMKAHGVPWLLRSLRGEISLAEAAAGAKADTRRYAKRQRTWFRHQLRDWTWMGAEAAMDDLSRRVR